MKKRLGIFYAVIVCACALLLNACATTQQDKASEAVASKASDKGAVDVPKDGQFVGSWILAVVKTEGMTIAGDFSLFFNDSDNITIDVKEDMTATMSFGDSDIDFTWEQVDEDTIEVVKTGEESQPGDGEAGVLGAFEKVSLTRRDASLVMSLSDVESGSSTDFIFTSDGTVKGYEALSADKASDIASSEELVGEWMLSGLSLSTMTLYGSPEDLSEMVGTSADTSMTIRDDGTGTVMGSSFTWESDGKTTVFNYGENLSTTAKNLDGDIILDMTEMLGGEVVTVMRFTK